MKTAIILTGHMRSFERCLPTLHWHVFRLFPGADFYVSTIKDQNSHKAELLREKYPNARVEIDVVDAQPEIPIPPGRNGWKPGQFYGHEPYAISVHPQQILRQLWQNQHAWEWFCSKNGSTLDTENNQVRPTENDYDLIIRCRPDLWFLSFAPPLSVMDDDFGTVGESRAFTPWWGRFGGVNDRFALLGAKAAAGYFNALANLTALMAAGCPLHPESLVKASIEAAGCTVDDRLRAEFSTLREDGTMRPPEAPLADQVHAGMLRT